VSAKICLGTAQLGLAYGIGNTSGKPDLHLAHQILDQAWDSGIRDFDTAALYGDSEAVLKSWIQSRNIGAEARIVTKLPWIPELSDEKRMEWIRESAYERLESLGVNTVEGILLHRAEDMQLPGVVEGLNGIVQAGICRSSGTSTYHPSEAESAMSGGLTAVQITYSILDRRFEHSGFLSRARDKNVKLYARSPFLQGLLLMKPRALPEHMQFAKPTLEKWKSLLDAYGLDALSTALGFSLNQSELDCVVLGAETPEQLTEILAAASRMPDANVLSELADQIGIIEERILLPYLWPKAEQ